MITVDTSALMAVLLDEPSAMACMQALCTADIAISAGTLAELLIVAGQRGLSGKAQQMIDELAMEIVSVDAAFARSVAFAYATWGKSNHPAGLNYGDCFAYALAKQRDWPLLFVGSDFSRTDIASAIGRDGH